MTEREILRRAKEVLLERGWCQHEPGKYAAGPVCTGGALVVAEDLRTWPGSGLGLPVWELLSSVIDGNSSFPAGSIALWNDEPGRTLEEVIDLIDQAIASLPRETRSGQETRHRTRLELLEAV